MSKVESWILLRKSFTEARIVALARAFRPHLLRCAFACGMVMIVSEDVCPKELTRMVLAMVEVTGGAGPSWGREARCPGKNGATLKKAAKDRSLPYLVRREQDILRLIGEGLEQQTNR